MIRAQCPQRAFQIPLHICFGDTVDMQIHAGMGIYRMAAFGNQYHFIAGIVPLHPVACNTFRPGNFLPAVYDYPVCIYMGTVNDIAALIHKSTKHQILICRILSPVNPCVYCAQAQRGKFQICIWNNNIVFHNILLLFWYSYRSHTGNRLFIKGKYN